MQSHSYVQPFMHFGVWHVMSLLSEIFTILVIGSIGESMISFNIFLGITSNLYDLVYNFTNVLITWDLSKTLNFDHLSSTSDPVGLNRLYPSKALFIFSIF